MGFADDGTVRVSVYYEEPEFNTRERFNNEIQLSDFCQICLRNDEFVTDHSTEDCPNVVSSSSDADCGTEQENCNSRNVCQKRRQDSSISSSTITSRKRVRKFSNGMMMVLILNACFSAGHSFDAMSPVLWKTSHDPIITGSTELFNRIAYISPCEIFQNEAFKVVWNDSTLQGWCDNKYHDNFLKPVMEMCSTVNSEPDTTYIISHSREKRAVPVNMYFFSHFTKSPTVSSLAVSSYTSISNKH